MFPAFTPLSPPFPLALPPFLYLGPTLPPALPFLKLGPTPSLLNTFSFPFVFFLFFLSSLSSSHLLFLELFFGPLSLFLFLNLFPPSNDLLEDGPSKSSLSGFSPTSFSYQASSSSSLGSLISASIGSPNSACCFLYSLIFSPCQVFSFSSLAFSLSSLDFIPSKLFCLLSTFSFSFFLFFFSLFSLIIFFSSSVFSTNS